MQCHPPVPSCAACADHCPRDMTHHRACLALLVLGCCQLCLMASSSADGTCTNQASHSEQAGALHSVRAMASASSSGEAPSGMELATLGGGCFWWVGGEGACCVGCCLALGACACPCTMHLPAVHSAAEPCP